ncbi:MAG: nitroreductase [Ignavibacteria bacterium RBG_13_36_8]|nr:MAG: nitroreductase [Ignavibacteria bacterium RBG_13_36_8]
MKFLELAKKRYSCRKYKDQPVEDEKLLQVLEAGRVAPSACNLQPWHFVVIRERKSLEMICSTYKREWLKSAPVIIVVCGDHESSWKREDRKDHCDIDIAIAIDHMTLQAAELGLATCWICQFNSMKCAEMLKLPSALEPIALLPVGYPDDSKNPDRHDKDRKSMDKVVHWEKF